MSLLLYRLRPFLVFFKSSKVSSIFLRGLFTTDFNLPLGTLWVQGEVSLVTIGPGTNDFAVAVIGSDRGRIKYDSSLQPALLEVLDVTVEIRREVADPAREYGPR